MRLTTKSTYVLICWLFAWNFGCQPSSGGADDLQEGSVDTASKDVTAPKPAATSVIASEIGERAMRVSWQAASDEVSGLENLTYSVLATASTLVSDDPIARFMSPQEGDVIVDWKVAITSTELIGLDPATTYAIYVFVRDEAQNIAIYDKQEATTAPLSGPTTGTSITFANLTYVSVTASWGAAHDSGTPTAQLEYKAVIANSSDAIDSVAKVLALPSANILCDWTAERVSMNVTELSGNTDYAIAVLVRDSDGLVNIYPPQIFKTVDTSAPVVGTGLNLSDLDVESFTVNWGPASDDVTTSDRLQYKLVTAESLVAIDTIAEANAITGAGLLLDWTSGVTSHQLTGLTHGTSYPLALLVRDEKGNEALYAPLLAGTKKKYRIFASVQNSKGNIGGITGADAMCQSDRNHPGEGAVFKAMLVDGVERVACTSNDCANGGVAEHVDWVLKPNSSYYRSFDGRLLNTTNNAGLLPFPLVTQMDTNSAFAWWTGLTQYWQTHENNCNRWTTDSEADKGMVGVYYQSYNFIAAGDVPCNTGSSLLKVGPPP